MFPCALLLADAKDSKAPVRERHVKCDAQVSTGVRAKVFFLPSQLKL